MAKEHPFEAVVEKFSDTLVALVESIPEEEMPFGSIELSADEQIDQYLRIRDNPTAWVQLIEEHGMRDSVEYAVEMEKRITKLTREA